VSAGTTASASFGETRVASDLRPFSGSNASTRFDCRSTRSPATMRMRSVQNVVCSANRPACVETTWSLRTVSSRAPGAVGPGSTRGRAGPWPASIDAYVNVN